MSTTASESLKNSGLSNEQIDRLTALQEAGRKLDFVYHYTDDGRDPRRAANQFDEFRAGLKAFAEEGVMPCQFAAALWDHLAPRFVGWRPEFIEDVEARHLTGALVRLDEHIDAGFGRIVPPELRAVSRDVRDRFDELVFQYDTGVWRDTRTAGEVRDELLFVAYLDEKIRNVLYGAAREIDVRKTIEYPRPSRSAGSEHFAEAGFEARSYQTQLARVSDFLDRIRAAGFEVRAGLIFGVEAQRSQLPMAATVRANVPVRPAPSGRNMQPTAVPRRSPTEAENYWRDVARSASDNAALGQSQSFNQTAPRGRSL